MDKFMQQVTKYIPLAGVAVGFVAILVALGSMEVSIHDQKPMQPAAAIALAIVSAGLLNAGRPTR